MFAFFEDEDTNFEDSTKIYRFKEWLRDRIEADLSSRPHIYEEGDVKIADINFAFQGSHFKYV